VFDIVIDDGSHRFEDQMTTFAWLWSSVKRGGVYVVEDIQHPEVELEFWRTVPGAAMYEGYKDGRYDDVLVIVTKE